MKNVFIDTNILLNFYNFNSEHLNKLENIINLVKENKITIYIPSQVMDEFERNRENEINKTLRYLRDNVNPNVRGNLTQQNIDEMTKINDFILKLKKTTEELEKKIIIQFKKRSLPADKLIKDIFKSAKIIELNDEIINKAKNRYIRGNPPGKKNSYGDAINWETLLSEVKNNEDLYFISGDSDYFSEIDSNEFSPFLQREWGKNKNSKIIFYKFISKFINKEFPEIKITKDDVTSEKDAYIASGNIFIESGSNIIPFPMKTENGDWAIIYSEPSKALDRAKIVMMNQQTDTIQKVKEIINGDYSKNKSIKKEEKKS